MPSTIYVFAKTIDTHHIDALKIFAKSLQPFEQVKVYEPFKALLLKNGLKEFEGFETFTTVNTQAEENALISLGGDGTLLDAVSLIGSAQIPILGINLGRMGFLATVAVSEIPKALKKLATNKFVIEPRVMLKAEANTPVFGERNYALNELTIHKRDNSSMIKIHTSIDDVFLNSYWADGLIISTPTGSTAYSLSCGGPIVLPGSNNFVITPVAPHNLNVRPIVIPDSKVITLRVEGRSDRFLASLDSKSVVINSSTVITVTKNHFNTYLIRQEKHDFASTIRKKLNWGLDIRN